MGKTAGTPASAVSRLREAQDYAEYLATPAGRARVELSWANLRRFLPADATGRRALDLGGGTGALSVRLATVGFQVALLDHSEEMIALARKAAAAGAVADRVSFCRADAAGLATLFPAASFDAVVCHNSLEYVADAAATVRDIGRALRAGGVLSLLVRNRAGEALKAAITGRGRRGVLGLLATGMVAEPLYGQPARLFSPGDLRAMLAAARLDVVAEHGVRVLFDYLVPGRPGDDEYRQLFDLEQALGARPEFTGLARYTQLIARAATPSRRC